MPISRCLTWLVIAPDQPFISPKRPASSVYRRVTRCQAVRARLPDSRRQGKEIGSDGNGNARGWEVVRFGCAPRSPFRDDRRKYSGAKLHRRKLIR